MEHDGERTEVGGARTAENGFVNFLKLHRGKPVRAHPFSENMACAEQQKFEHKIWTKKFWFVDMFTYIICQIPAKRRPKSGQKAAKKQKNVTF